MPRNRKNPNRWAQRGQVCCVIASLSKQPLQTESQSRSSNRTALAVPVLPHLCCRDDGAAAAGAWPGLEGAGEAAAAVTTLTVTPNGILSRRDRIFREQERKICSRINLVRCLDFFFFFFLFNTKNVSGSSVGSAGVTYSVLTSL